MVLGVRTVEIGVSRGQLQDVGLERSSHQHRDAQPERGDLLRERFGPALECSFRCRVGTDRRHASDCPLARDHDDPAAAGGSASPGRSSLVSRTGPKKFVEKICSHTPIGISSRQPTPAIPALCTRPSGDPTASWMALPAATIEFGIVEVERAHRSGEGRPCAAAGDRPEAFESLLGRPHGGHHRPAGMVEVCGGGQAEAAGRAGDDDAAAISHCRYRIDPSSAAETTLGLPLGWPLSQPDQMPAKYGPGWPLCS